KRRFSSRHDPLSEGEGIEPAFTGIRVIEPARMPLRELVDYIDWTPFFQTWELAGHYPQILKDEVVGEQARKLFDDAQAMLKRLVQADLVHRQESHRHQTSSIMRHASLEAHA